MDCGDGNVLNLQVGCVGVVGIKRDIKDLACGETNALCFLERLDLFPPPPSIWFVKLQPQSINRLIQSVDQSRSAVAIKSPEGQPESQVIPKIVDKGGEGLHQVSFVS